MGKNSHTKTVNTASGQIAFPTQQDGLVAITNIGANNVWYPTDNTVVTAVPEADEMAVIRPGATVLVGGRVTMPMIAETGATKIVFDNAQGRRF